ncbi:hypothetical protein JWG39_13195 [Desulforhopalus vacuolatus]|uniref:hypothetical protein n=1 Tax=Desulforhopalus vacuolatus TaxID=40414 RepID=UPI00196455A9|nr:hypothetical protein [Desulforhopalus vacuolatus]MBM9520772.1 hypothetical protein [Desulforhopalus vacuolatus]
MPCLHGDGKRNDNGATVTEYETRNTITRETYPPHYHYGVITVAPIIIGEKSAQQ